MFTCNTMACHFNAGLIPLSMASSSTMLICWMLFISRSQHASSVMASLVLSATPTASELASTHMFNSFISKYYSLWAGFSCCTQVRVSDILHSSGASQILSSQFCVTVMAQTLMKPITIGRHPHMGKYPISCPHIVIGLPTILLPHHHRSQPYSLQTSSPNILAQFCTGDLCGINKGCSSKFCVGS